MKNKTFSLPFDDQHTGSAQYFDVVRELSELLAAGACYLLLVLQFFMKKERKNK